MKNDNKDQLFNYRQPMVTAAGIILGFVLNFTTDLVKRGNNNNLLSILILTFIASGIIFLIITLFRILNHNYNKEFPEIYYGKTLRLFIYGVILSFSGGIIKLLQTLFTL
ncbi:hypothetical protein [Algoriphagus sp.]|uniref:hypothetical protein n=1 Tax=Algoriphagus sp. TaxID=1872435 RepID=UPI0025FB6D93|nr:hypothetical protein [Algoriphagus sp.]